MSAAPEGTDTDQLLATRATTHGDYSVCAFISQRFRMDMRATPNWHALHPHERESLEMIALKMGRILAGDPHLRDHWDDIAGYARLAAERNGGAL